MKLLKVLGLLAAFGLVLVGCNDGPDLKAAEKNSQDMKEYNEKALKENPPPPGEGPGN